MFNHVRRSCALIILGVALTTGAQANFYDKARALQELGDIRAAIIELKNAIDQEPRDLPSRLLLGDLYMGLADYKSAVIEFEEALELGADSNLVLPKLGVAYLAMSRHQDILDKVPARGHAPEVLPELTLLRAAAYLALQKLTEAELAYNEAAKLLPGSAAPWTGRARVAMAKGDRPLALSFLSKALKIDPRHAESWFERGQLLRRTGGLEKALVAFDRAIAENNQHLRARNGRAGVLADLGRLDEARSEVDFVRQQNPIDVEAMFLDALLLVRSGDTEAARTTLKDSNELVEAVQPESMEKHPPLLLLAGLLDFHLGNDESALKRLGLFIRKIPGHIAATKAVAELQIRQGAVVEAGQLLESIVGTPGGTDSSVLAMLGESRALSGKPKEAIELFTRAISTSRNPAPLLVRLARARFTLGQHDGARQALEQALEANPKYTPAALALIQLHIDKRNFQLAQALAVQNIKLNPEEPMLRVLNGAALARAGRLEDAKLAFEEALEVEPQFKAAHLALANLDIQKGKFSKAAIALRALLEEHPGDADLLLRLGDTALGEGTLDEALTWLQKANDAAPERVDIRRKLGDVYLGIGAKDKARPILDVLADEHPDDPRVLLSFGRLLAVDGHTQLATKSFTKAVGLARSDVPLLLELSREQVKQRDLSGARKSLQAALTVNPDSLTARAAWISVIAQQGKLRNALKEAGQLVAAHPRRPSVHRLHGEVLMQAKKPKEAVSAFNRAMTLRPSSALAQRVSQAHLQDGDPGAATRGLQAWLEQRPGDVAARKLLAESLLVAGDQQAASTQYERVLHIAPKDAVTLNNLAWLYGELGDPRAEETAAKALRLAPENPTIMDTYGWILVGNGEYSRALTLLRGAHSRVSQDPVVRYHMAVALHRLGRDSEAIEHLRAAMASASAFAEAEAAKKLLKSIGG